MKCPFCKKTINVVTVSENAKKAGSQKSEAKTRAARENIRKRWDKIKGRTS